MFEIGEDKQLDVVCIGFKSLRQACVSCMVIVIT